MFSYLSMLCVLCLDWSEKFRPSVGGTPGHFKWLSTKSHWT